MYNLRYHIASLIAVFLALAVGLLLGTVVVERGIVSRQRTALVEELRTDFNSIRTDNSTLKRQNQQLLSFSGEAVNTFVRERLADRVILVLADPTRGEAVARTSEALVAAGAKPIVVSFTDGGLGLSDPKVAQQIAATMGVDPKKDLESELAKQLALEWTTTAPRRVTQILVDGGRLSMEMGKDEAASGAVIVGTSGGKADRSLITLGLALRGPNRVVVGAETSTKRTGVVEAAAQAGLSTVDDVDLPLGRLSLVWVLDGTAKGRFGIGADVEEGYPRPLFPK